MSLFAYLAGPPEGWVWVLCSLHVQFTFSTLGRYFLRKSIYKMRIVFLPFFFLTMVGAEEGAEALRAMFE